MREDKSKSKKKTKGLHIVELKVGEAYRDSSGDCVLCAQDDLLVELASGDIRDTDFYEECDLFFHLPNATYNTGE